VTFQSDIPGDIDILHLLKKTLTLLADIQKESLGGTHRFDLLSPRRRYPFNLTPMACAEGVALCTSLGNFQT
jgi:hypothetical protein